MSEFMYKNNECVISGFKAVLIILRKKKLIHNGTKLFVVTVIKTNEIIYSLKTNLCLLLLKIQLVSKWRKLCICFVCWGKVYTCFLCPKI